MARITSERDKIVEQYKKRLSECENKSVADLHSKEMEIQTTRDRFTEVNKTEISKVKTDKDRIIDEYKMKLS